MTASNHKNLRPVEVVSLAEKALWGERQYYVKQLNSYKIKNSFFPYRMDEWHEKQRQICRDYNMRIARLNRIRKKMTQYRKNAYQSLNHTCDTYDVYDEIMEIESDTQSEISDVTTDISENEMIGEHVDYHSDDDTSPMFGFQQVLIDSLKFVWG